MARTPTWRAAAAVLVLAGCVSSGLEQRLEHARGEVPFPPDEPPAASAEVPGLADGAVSWASVSAAVLARNPRLESMRAAWRAMLERMPQVVASPDPTLELGIAPFSRPTGRAQRVAWRQPLAWAATLDAQGKVVLAEAEALGRDREATARMLVAAAHEALVDLGAAAALADLYHQHHQLMDTLRRGVLAMVAAGRGLPEDAVRAEAEVVMADRELVALRRTEHVAHARLNALLHRPSDAPLGRVALPPRPPPAPPPLSALVAEARAKRPELAAAAARVRAREAEREVADSMGRPMFGIGVEVSTMGEEWTMWPMLMVMIELPFSSARFEAMRDEARAMTAMQRWETAALADDIEAEVGTRRAELEAALAALEQTKSALIPTLERRIELVQASYAANRRDFDQVVMAANALLEARLEGVVFEREAHLAAIALEVALGRLLGGPVEPAP
jgi:outer membrane protein TolC